MRGTLAAALILVAFAIPGGAQDGEEELPSEVIAPATDSRDPEWKPLYLHYEDPVSVNCGRRAACERAIENATGEAS